MALASSSHTDIKRVSALDTEDASWPFENIDCGNKPTSDRVSMTPDSCGYLNIGPLVSYPVDATCSRDRLSVATDHLVKLTQ
ncbi:hypothetical protein LSAT2_015455 [Lamellibrachia satsuma]|nr:hypothetical protein LSAT2_015455 [Lamellibrachia satsuma]